MVDDSMLWTILIVVVASLLIFDLCVLNRKKGDMSFKRAVLFSAFFISAGLLFGVFIFLQGSHSAAEYYAGYAIELMMSIDNLFVFIIIFAYFRVPNEYQHKALFYGIIGAIIFRMIFIFAGVQLLDRFDFMMYIFGIILIFTAVRTVLKKENKDGNMDKNLVVRGCRKVMKVTDEYDGAKFFTRRNGILMATPLFVTVLVLEATDIVFAFDSIPAVLAITTDMYIVCASNMFAILGLRSLYFALRGAISSLEYLKYGLGAILMFIGMKMLLSQHYHIDVLISLAVIIIILSVTVVLSILLSKKKRNAAV